MKRKKVLFIVEAMGGGVFTYVTDLVNKLVETYDMYVAYQIRKQTPMDYITYFDKRIHLIKVENFGRSIDPIKDTKAFFEIRRIVKEVQPDVIHLHSSKAGVLGRWAFNGKKIPMFYTPHGYSFLIKNYSSGKRKLFHLIENVSAKRRCTTISCSKGEHQATLKMTKDAIYINNGIDIDSLKNTLSRIKKETKKYDIFTLGRICPQKNPSQFNEIALAMPERSFLWIGDGELREKLTAPNIDIAGWVDREKALELSTQADVFLLPSLWEGLPISLLEAMFMKKLCVVSNVVGNRDVIQNGKNGFVCNTTEEFVKVLKECSGDRFDECRAKAYSEIFTEYNITVMAKKYALAYERKMRQHE